MVAATARVSGSTAMMRCGWTKLVCAPKATDMSVSCRRVFSLERGEALISSGVSESTMLIHILLPSLPALQRASKNAAEISMASLEMTSPTIHGGRRPTDGTAQARAIVLIRILSESGSTVGRGAVYVSGAELMGGGNRVTAQG